MNEVRGIYFDTFVSIVSDCGKALLDEALALCAPLEASLSRFLPESDVSRLNAAGGAEVSLTRGALEVIKQSVKLSALTEGAFDITIGSASRLWNFTDGSGKLPDGHSLSRAAALTDWRGIRINGDKVSLAPGQYIDLGGIGKGYAADHLRSFLKDRGAKHALINIGGDIAAVGTRPDGQPWSIGLQRPFGSFERDIWASIGITDSCVVTSGTDRRGFDAGGVRQHHILDPRTGAPCRSGLISVTVFCGSAAVADALATAFFVMGKEKGLKSAGALGAEAVFLCERGEADCTPGAARALNLLDKE